MGFSNIAFFWDTLKYVAPPEGKQIEEDSIWRLSHNSCCYNTPNAHKHKLRIGYTMSNPIEDQVDDIFFYIYQCAAAAATYIQYTVR